MVALSTVQRQLRIVQVTVDWNPAADFKTSLNMNPTLTEQHLTWTTWPGLADAPETQTGVPSITQLSHLEILPSVNDGKERHLPEILMARSRLPDLGANPHILQEPVTIIDRWKVLPEQKQELHPSLVALGNKYGKTPAGNLQSATRLAKLEPFVVSKILIGVHVAHFGKTLVLSYADGSVEYRDRKTLDEIDKEPSLERVMSLRQVGFTFEEELPCKKDKNKSE